MEDLLTLYTEPLPDGHEVHCMDETPKQLLGTPHGSMSPAPGRYRRIDYEYARQGRVNIFVAVAPFAGTRTVRVTDRRTAEDTASFLWDYCMTQHRDARHIDLVADNLNTHKEKILRKTWGPERSEAFFSRVTIHFTPPHGSWLNLAELEINCLKTQGLRRRIPTKNGIIGVAASIVAARNQDRRTISWSFTKEKARERFPVLYAGD